MHKLAFAFALALCLAAPARADDDPGNAPVVPRKGDATITLLGGWRAAPQHDWVAEQQRDGFNPQHDLFQPGAVASLGFAADEELHVTIDIGYAYDHYALTTGTASAQIVTILLGADTPIWVTPYFTVYGGGGLGYSLNTFNSGGGDVESNSSAGFLKLGARIPLTHKIALVIEDRYVVSNAYWPAMNSSFTVGGNLLTVGFMFHFFSPDDPGHPQAPSDRL